MGDSSDRGTILTNGAFRRGGLLDEGARGLSERGLTRVGEWAYWRGGLLEMRVVLDREGSCLFEREAQQRRGHITEGSLLKKGGGHNRQGGY